uniref:Uncharacterized protein n=1 Tax=Human herpesvirus 2 TaxID=10310 RepID=A0A481TN20_HHV2|nr:hypothetical protein [Human alphaherpesvirus 2]QBH83004.1 hypothetical protein [Human alphaherpesvirus 2]
MMRAIWLSHGRLSGSRGAENKDAVWTAVSKITRPALQMSITWVYGSPARTSGAFVSMVPAIP